MRPLVPVVLSLFLTSTLVAADVVSRDIEPVKRPLGRAMILETHAPLTDADRATLATSGIVVSQPLSEGRYLARVHEGAQKTADARVASLEPLTAEKKIHRSALRAAVSGKPFADLTVYFQRDVDVEAARAAIVEAGGMLDDPLRLRFSPSRSIRARVPASALTELASDERVLSVGAVPKARMKNDNIVSAGVSRVTDIQAAPYGLSGEGVTVSLFELAAAQQSHVEFGGRLTVIGAGGTSSDRNHATHVAGTIGAGGVNANAKGMAPKARIIQHCVETPSNNCTSENWLDDKYDLLHPEGVVVDNNSWGYILAWTSEDGYPVWIGDEEYQGAYALEYGTVAIDEISIERNILFVHSAGNEANRQNFSTEWSEHRHVDEDYETITDKMFCTSKDGSGTDCPTAICTGGCEAVRHDLNVPYDTIGATASGKNTITVGAVSATVGSPIDVIGFSSRGPAKDGRIKPDVVARGANVLSSVPTDQYSRLSGTSMAAPAVTGIAALITEQWRRTFAGANPTPQQLKALIIAGTRDVGNPGPDYTFGFGLVDAKNSVDLILADAGTGQRIKTISLGQGATQETSVAVPSTQNLRVVLNWADPPVPFVVEDRNKKALVNDLDIRIIDPAGNTHLPYVLDKTQVTANATRGINNTDNVEMIDIPNAGPGLYRVVAAGTRLGEGPQQAILVANAPLSNAVPCTDVQEAIAANNTPDSAWGNLVPGQTVNAALCAEGDVDYYRFRPTRSGPVAVTINAGDTPLRAVLSGTGSDAQIDVPANQSRTITVNATAVPVQLLLRIEASGTRGSLPQYSFSTSFSETIQPRRRGVRH